MIGSRCSQAPRSKAVSYEAFESAFRGLLRRGIFYASRSTGKSNGRGSDSAAGGTRASSFDAHKNATGTATLSHSYTALGGATVSTSSIECSESVSLIGAVLLSPMLRVDDIELSLSSNNSNSSKDALQCDFELRRWALQRYEVQ